jgi:Spy/CpxP family protein refolding chaperone
MALLAGIVIAQEMMEKTDDKDQVPMMRGRGMMGRGQMQMRGRGGMMGMGRMGRGGMMGNMGIMGRLADEIDLSEEQKDEIKDIHTSHRKDMIRMKADRELAQVELQEIMHQDSPDLDAIEDQIRNIANLEAKMKFSQIKTRIDVKSVLTEEQQAKLKELMKNRPARRTGGRRAGAGKPGEAGPMRGRRRRGN